jgi:NADH:ubiquinone oxidoreductase subunit F (NADH-binding)
MAIGQLYNQPHPKETRVLTWRFGKPDSWKIDTYLADGGYQTFLKARQMTPEAIIDEVKASGLRGRGGGLPDGTQVELRAPVLAQAEVHRLQRRRIRTRHLQGSPADGV